MEATTLKRKTPLKQGRIKRRKRRRPRDNSGWNLTEWMKHCDGLWAKAVKLRDRHTCRCCGSTGRVEAHHHRGRQDKYHRHHMENGMTLCALCHTFSSALSAHGTPKKWLEVCLPIKAPEALVWLDGVLAEEREEAEAAFREQRCPQKIHPNPTIEDYRNIASRLEAAIEKQEAREWTRRRLGGEEYSDAEEQMK